MLTGQGQPVQFHPTPAASRRVGQFPQTAAALASPPEAGQSPQGHGGGRWGQRRWRGFPPARLLTAGASQGATAQKSKSQQVVAIPARNAKLTNVTGKNEKKKKKMGGRGRQTKTEPPDLLPGAEDAANGGGWARGWEGLAGPALHLALRAVLVVRGPCTPTAQACDPVAHVEQHHLQRVRVHAPLVGLGGALHVLHNSACEVFTLREGSRGRHAYRGSVSRGSTHRLSCVCGGACTYQGVCVGVPMGAQVQGKRVLGCTWMDGRTDRRQDTCEGDDALHWGWGHTVTQWDLHQGVHTPERLLVGPHWKVKSTQSIAGGGVHGHGQGWTCPSMCGARIPYPGGGCTDTIPWGGGTDTTPLGVYTYHTLGGMHRYHTLGAGHRYQALGGGGGCRHSSPTPFFCCHSSLKERS